MGDVTAQDIADFQDSRLDKVSAASVRREICILSSVFESARLEWGWTDPKMAMVYYNPHASTLAELLG